MSVHVCFLVVLVFFSGKIKKKRVSDDVQNIVRFLGDDRKSCCEQLNRFWRYCFNANYNLLLWFYEEKKAQMGNRSTLLTYSRDKGVRPESCDNSLKLSEVHECMSHFGRVHFLNSHLVSLLMWSDGLMQWLAAWQAEGTACKVEE